MTPNISVSLLGTQSDERLSSLAASGHERAFEAIVERYSKALTRYAERFLGQARSEEVVQAAFLSAWSALTTGTEVRDLRPWLYRIVHNGALNAMNRSESGELELIEATDGALSPHAILEQNEEVRSALNVIAELPERQRAALLAVAVDGRAHADVAADLGVSDAGVRQLVRRARVQLRTAATALTPLPLALWLADGHRGPAPDVSHRIAEVLSDGGGNALAASAMKAGAIVVSVAAVATAAPKVGHVIEQGSESAPAVAIIGAASAGASGVGVSGPGAALIPGGSAGGGPLVNPHRGPNGSSGAPDGFGTAPGALALVGQPLGNQDGSQQGSGQPGDQAPSPIFTPLPTTPSAGRGGSGGRGSRGGRGDGGPRNNPGSDGTLGLPDSPSQSDAPSVPTTPSTPSTPSTPNNPGGSGKGDGGGGKGGGKSGGGSSEGGGGKSGGGGQSSSGGSSNDGSGGRGYSGGSDQGSGNGKTGRGD